MNKLIILFIIGIVFCSSSVLGSLIIQPQVNNYQVFMGQSKAFNLSLWNNNSYSIYNISFSSVSGVTFPVVDVLAAGESRSVDVVVFSPNVQSWSGLSLVSFLYDVPLNLTPVNVSLNVSDTGVVPSSLSIFVGDGVFLNNFFNDSIELRDLGDSGFPEIVLSANSSVFVDYPLGSFSFYGYPFGWTGALSVLPRPEFTRVHSSVFDVPVSFSIVSSLVQSSLQVNVFNNNFSSNPNQSQVGLLEVKNLLNVAVVNVSLSSPDGWIVFSEPVFDVPALGNKIVQFNVTPRLNRTVDTNKSYVVPFFVRANNVDSFNSSVNLFVFYGDLDVLFINGTKYVINRLSIPETILFCTATPSDAECLGLVDAFRTNVTVVQEVPASQLIDEPTLLTIQSQASMVGDVATRIENSYNINKDFLNSIASRFDEFASQMNQTQHDYNVSMSIANRRNKDLSSRQGWMIGIFIVLVLFFVGVWFAGYNLWIKYLIKGGQL
jgi:hypothetical protein